jgi:hypothetical protein
MILYMLAIPVVATSSEPGESRISRLRLLRRDRVSVLAEEESIPSMADIFPEDQEYTIRGMVSDAVFTETPAMHFSEPADVISTWRDTADTINSLIARFRTASNGWRVSLVPDPRATCWTESDDSGTEYEVEETVSKKSSGNSVYYCRAFPPPHKPHTPESFWWKKIKRSMIGASRRVFATNANPNLVIKYDNTCQRIYRNSHPWRDSLYSEYIMMKAIQSLGISPRVVSLSEATLPTLAEWKTDPRITRDDPAFCVEKRAHVRALIMERTGMSLADFRYSFGQPTVPYLLLTIRIGIKAIELIETLHNAGIVHGDIHPGNVAFRYVGKEATKTPNLVLLDFGLSRFFPSEYGKDFHGFHPSISTDHLDQTLLSPWQFYQLSRTGRRDDIYRAVELVLSIMTEDDWFRAYLKLDDRTYPVSRLSVRKQWGAFFTRESLWTGSKFLRICDVYMPNLDGVICNKAMEHLNGALENVRSIVYPDERPDYTKIKQYFQDAHDCFHDARTASSRVANSIKNP